MARKKLSKHTAPEPKSVATLRDGCTITIQDEVTTRYPGCKGKVFVVIGMEPYEKSESGMMVIVEEKGNPENKLLGLSVPGYNKPCPDGLDANWFRKSV